MTPSPNRARLEVTLGVGWRPYQTIPPRGMTMLGTVTRGIGDTGALALVEATQQLVQLNAGAIRTLDQRKARAALEAARAGKRGGAGLGGGRRAEDGAAGLRRRTVLLDDATVERLRALGDGELSLGIRRAAQRG